MTKITDHNGNQFKSIKEMANHYGISKQLYNARIHRLKWTLEKTLTTPVKTDQTAVTDHKGTVYKNTNELIETYGINKNAYQYHIKAGWPLEKALTTPIHSRQTIITDHNGNVYKNLDEMTTTYNINKRLYRYRINAGWALEKALTTPARKHKKKHN